MHGIQGLFFWLGLGTLLNDIFALLCIRDSKRRPDTVNGESTQFRALRNHGWHTICIIKWTTKITMVSPVLPVRSNNLKDLQWRSVSYDVIVCIFSVVYEGVAGIVPLW